MAGLGKPKQETISDFSQEGIEIHGVITAMDVHFWGDLDSGQAFIQANGLPPYVMSHATAVDFN